MTGMYSSDYENPPTPDPYDDEAPVDETDREPIPRLWRATDLDPIRQPAWLAKDRLPRSAVTILVGDEGIGKSLLWVWIIAAVTTGRQLAEFGIPARDPGIVVLVLTEDEWSSTVRPRLEVAGADLNQIRVICTDRDGSGSPTFPGNMYLLTGMDPAPAMVVIDAFADTVPGNLSLKDPQQARRALHPWKECATVTGAAIMLLTHTNRADSKNARDKYGLTAELRKKARMTLYAQQDDEGHLVVGPEKSNITGHVPASMFTIRPVQKFQPTVDHDGTVPLLEYAGQSNLSARDYIEANYDTNHGGDDSDDREAIDDWLTAYLGAGRRESSAVYKAADAAGYSKDQAKRSKKRLRVRASHPDLSGPWFWELPTSEHDDLGSTKGAQGSGLESHVPDVLPSAPLGAARSLDAGTDQPSCFIHRCRLVDGSTCPQCTAEAS